MCSTAGSPRSNLMQKPLVIPTERDDVLLRQCSSPEMPALIELIRNNADRIGWDANETRLRKNLLSTSIFSFGIWCTQTPIGYIYLQPLPAAHYAEVGYWLDKEHTGKGFATSALRGLSEFAFVHMGYTQLSALVKESNGKSRAVLERVGFHQIAYAEGFLSYAIQANEWPM